MQIARYVNTFFRHWPLYLLPAVIIAGIMIGVSFTIKPKYGTSATVWVEESGFLDPSYRTAQNDGAYYDSPAQRKSRVFEEYVQSRSFVREIVSKTSFKELLNKQSTSDEIIDDIQANTKTTTNGFHSFTMTYSHANPARSNEITRAMLDRFMLEQREAIKRTGQGAIDFAKTQLDQTQKDLDTAQKSLTSFASQNTCTIQKNDQQTTISETDLKCQQLTTELEKNRTKYYDQTDRLKGLQAAYGAAVEGKDLSLRITDQPETIDPGSAGRKLAPVFGLGGFAVGLLLALIGVVVITWADHSIRLRAHASRYLDPVQVFEVPMIKTPNPQKQKDGKLLRSPDVRQRMIAQLKWATKEEKSSQTEVR